jgi:hypothetical protein
MYHKTKAMAATNLHGYSKEDNYFSGCVSQLPSHHCDKIDKINNLKGGKRTGIGGSCL